MYTPPTSRENDRTHPTSEARARLLDGLPVTETTLRPGGVATAVLEGGDGPPMVLLHGPGESSLWWMRVIPTLVRTHRVIVPDLPGHGASESDPAELDADVLAPDGTCAWLNRLIDRTCSSAPVLVGHLLGGAIAARFATGRFDGSRFPGARSAAPHGSAVSRLVLVDSLGLATFLPAPRFAFNLVRFMVRPSERTYDRFLGQCMVDPQNLREQMGASWEPFLAYNLAKARDSDAKAALGTLMRNVGVPRIPAEDLERIAVPTSLIWGRDDRATKLHKARAVGERHGWPLHVIEDTGDDPKMERPDAFLRALYAILEMDGPPHLEPSERPDFAPGERPDLDASGPSDPEASGPRQSSRSSSHSR